MSDFEDYFDDDEDEYYYLEDGPLDLADDLAEHTMHSPVWQEADPADGFADYWSDWEYYSDDYYDNGRPANYQELGDGMKSEAETGQKRKLQVPEDGRKRQKLSATKEPSKSRTHETRLHESEVRKEVKQPASIVRWRSGGDAERGPRLDPDSGEHVALLKDWRTKFGVMPSQTNSDQDRAPQPNSVVKGSRKNPRAKKSVPGRKRPIISQEPESNLEAEASLPLAKGKRKRPISDPDASAVDSKRSRDVLKPKPPSSSRETRSRKSNTAVREENRTSIQKSSGPDESDPSRTRARSSRYAKGRGSVKEDLVENRKPTKGRNEHN
ncbi:MAG: hypothetical protein M1819_004501 [Sarea resinae]|nr:MAG: hypothetical protein M1819_004501 [Sarea resinae]